MTDPAQIVPFAVYEAVSGRIKRTGFCQLLAIPTQFLMPGEAILALAVPLSNPAAWHIDLAHSPPVPAQRVAFTGIMDKTVLKADGLDKVTTTGLPPGTVCKTNGPAGMTETVVNDGAWHFSTTMAGGYYAYIDPYPMMDFNAFIRAEA